MWVGGKIASGRYKLMADYYANRRILEIICLNFRLDDASLCPIWRKPFEVLAEGLLVQRSRGDWI